MTRFGPHNVNLLRPTQRPETHAESPQAEELKTLGGGGASRLPTAVAAVKQSLQKQRGAPAGFPAAVCDRRRGR